MLVLCCAVRCCVRCQISSYLPNKNVNDCVAYYYYSKLQVNYKELVRNQQKRARMDKRGARRKAGDAQQTDGDDDGQPQQEDDDDDDRITDDAGDAVPFRKKERPRVRPKPRGISRELIGLAIDLSNQGKHGDARQQRGSRPITRADEAEDSGGEGDDAEDDEAGEDGGGNEARGDEEEREQPSQENADGRGREPSDAVPTSALPTHLDLYDDDDDKDAHMSDAAEHGLAQRGRRVAASDDDAEEDDQATQAGPATSSAHKDDEGGGASTGAGASPKANKRRRLSKSGQSAAGASGGAPLPPRPYWSDAERALFLSGVDEFGKNFSAIAAHVGTKSAEQVKNFWNNGKAKLNLEERLQQRRQHAEPHAGKQSADHAMEVDHAVPVSPAVSIPAYSVVASSDSKAAAASAEAQGGDRPRRSSVSSEGSSGSASPDGRDIDEDREKVGQHPSHTPRASTIPPCADDWINHHRTLPKPRVEAILMHHHLSIARSPASPHRIAGRLRCALLSCAVLWVRVLVAVPLCSGWRWCCGEGQDDSDPAPGWPRLR